MERILSTLNKLKGDMARHEEIVLVRKKRQEGNSDKEKLPAVLA